MLFLLLLLILTCVFVFAQLLDSILNGFKHSFQPPAVRESMARHAEGEARRLLQL